MTKAIGKNRFRVYAMLILLALLATACGSSKVNVYNPAGIREDGVYVDELLKKVMLEINKTRPPLAGEFPKETVEKIKVGKDAFADINDLFYRRGWTDGLPIVPPTEERVHEMLKGTDLAPDHVVGIVDHMKGQATVEKIAVNAVMAGCRPEHMPVLIAAVQVISQPDFGLFALSTTTNPNTPMIIVNGPIAKELDINAGTNALGRGWQANATISRALHLIVNNIGGSWPGINDMSCLGTPGDIIMMLAENEERNPWQPLHVELGFEEQANVVTVVGAEGTQNLMAIGMSSEEYLTVVADYMAGSGRLKRSNVILIVALDTAAMLAQEGWTKEGMREYIAEKASALAADPSTTDPEAVFENLMIIVSGGPGEKSMLIPIRGSSSVMSQEIELPSNWDELLQAAQN